MDAKCTVKKNNKSRGPEVYLQLMSLLQLNGQGVNSQLLQLEKESHVSEN
jgi:hypothetical protein